MKLIVGLGNPGEEYKNTRHNAGFIFVDYLAKNASFKFNQKFSCEIIELNEDNEKIMLVKPQTFMNKSGETVSKIVNFYKISSENIYIIHDDLDIRLGEFKMQKGVGPKVHNGILSIEEMLGTHEFWRVRIGVDNRTDIKIPGADYVLGNFTAEEKEKLLNIFDEIAAGINPSQ